MLPVDEGGNARETSCQKTLDQRAPAVGMHDIRALASEQAGKVPNHPPVVTSTSIQMENRHVGCNELPHFSCRTGAANHAHHAALIQAIRQFQYAVLHAPGLERVHQMQDSYGVGTRWAATQAYASSGTHLAAELEAGLAITCAAAQTVRQWVRGRPPEIPNALAV